MEMVFLRLVIQQTLTKYLLCASQQKPLWLFLKKQTVSAWKGYYWSDLSKPKRTLCKQSSSKTPFICSDLGCPGTDSHHIKYMWHSLTHFSRKLWIWSFGCSYLTPGKASHKYFPCSFKPSNAWFSPLILKQCIYFQLGRLNIFVGPKESECLMKSEGI